MRERKLVFERVTTLPTYVHGGDIQTYIDRHGFAPLDLSANINPFGIPDAVRSAMHRAVDNCTQYPDPFCRAARQAIGAREGVNPDFLYCGNGAADVLDRLAAVLKPRKVLLTAPTFAEYERTLSGAEIRVHNLRETDSFALTERILDEISPELDAVYLCNPNNPTGRTAQPELLREIVRKCTENSVKLVVDECFLDFLAARDALTAKTVLRDAPNLIILKAFTKLYAMAGVRLGYALCSDAALLDKMRAAGQPWAVSGLAQAAGLAALDETAYADSVRTLIADQRPRLAAGLRALGLRVVDGQANYLLFRAPADFGAKLRRHGAVVRGCGNYPGLDETWYRTAVRTQKENEQLLKIMREVLA